MAQEVMYVAKDLRSIVMPNYAGDGGDGAAAAVAMAASATATHINPPCIWVRFDGDRSSIPAWLLTPALLAYLWRQGRKIDAKIANGEVDPAKAILLIERFERIMSWAERSLSASDVQRQVVLQRRQAFELAAPLSRQHDPQISVLGDSEEDSSGGGDGSCTTETPSLLPPAERADLARLLAWYATFAPPTAPYQLSPGVTVSDPQRAHAYYRERIREGVRGQAEVGLCDWVRRHWERFGETT